MAFRGMGKAGCSIECKYCGTSKGRSPEIQYLDGAKP